jgi:hypothetical protein
MATCTIFGATMKIKPFFVSSPVSFEMLFDPDFCSLNRELGMYIMYVSTRQMQ